VYSDERWSVEIIHLLFFRAFRVFRGQIAV